MGQVWRAHHELLGQPVAIKVVTQAGDADLKQRIAREARVMALVRHPHVVTILDAGLIDGSIVIAMEWLEGETLAQRVSRVGPLPWETATHLGIELALGLAAIHRADLIHRDLKPQNVMLCGRDPEVLKVLDLGLARPMDGAMKLTVGNLVVGTPGYMAPEQVLARPLDARADLYALGLIFYELVSGELPWNDPSLAGAFRRTHEVLPRPFAPKRLPGLPLPLLQLMSALLAVSPEGRPSAMEVVERLRHLAGLQKATPTQASSPSMAVTATGLDATQLRPAAPQAGPVDATVIRTTAVKEPEPVEETRTRYLVVARLPPSRLARPLVRKALAGLVEGRGRSFTLGDGLWFATLVGQNDRQTAGLAEELSAKLRQEFGETAAMISGPVSADFILTTAALTGQCPLPGSLQQLIEALERE